MKHKLQHARSLSLSDWGILMEAWLTLSWIDFAISHLPFQRWKSWLGSNKGSTNNTAVNNTHEIDHLVRLLNAAANNHPRKPTCLRRSLGLKKLLERRGIAAVLCIGVTKGNLEVNAHAWIECDGIAVNDSADVALRYSQFPTITEELLHRIDNQ